MKKRLLSPSMAIGLLFAVLFALLFYAKPTFLENLESLTYDARAKIRQNFLKNPRTTDLAIVAIDDESLSKIGRWPWPRIRMAELINKIHASGARVTAVNLLFSEPESNQGLNEIRQLQGVYGSLLLNRQVREPRNYSFLTELSSAEVRLDNDSKLISSIQEAGNVILPMSFGLEDGASPENADTPQEDELPIALEISPITKIENPQDAALYPLAQARTVGLPLDDFAESAAGIGHVNIVTDGDGVLRHALPIVRFLGKDYPSFALEITRRDLNIEPDAVLVRLGHSIQMGRTRIPLDRNNRFAIDFPKEKIATYSAFDVLNDKVQPAALKNKIVIVGFTATGLGTLYTTPVANNVSGVEYIAAVTGNILANRFVTRPPWAENIEWIALLIVALFISFVLPQMKAGTGFAFSTLLCLLMIGSSIYFFVEKGFWIRIFYSLAMLISAYIFIISHKFLSTEKKKELVEASEIETNKMLGLSFQGQGQLDLAFEKFRKCPVDDPMKDTLYNLGLDFERKRQFNKAVSVYEHIAKNDPQFKDINSKMDLLKKAADGAVFGNVGGKAARDGTVMIDSAAAKPMLGRYEIVKELGRGAMGVVYQGRDPKINRTVAIKTMMFDDDIDEATLKELKNRFFREAESAGNLSHANIVKIYDAGEDQDMAYIAMEMMEGEDLKSWTNKANLLPIPNALDFIAKVAEALAYAHQMGVIHRDIKPANIMLLTDGTVRVADFGIARIQGSSQTATGTVIGTPSYMSPEQIAGKKVDNRSDIFSLGVTLFELLTGEKPFKGGDAIGTLLFQIANDPHPDARTLRADIPESVVTILNKALTKDPEQRYQSASLMAQDLVAALVAMGYAPSGAQKNLLSGDTTGGAR